MLLLQYYVQMMILKVIQQDDIRGHISQQHNSHMRAVDQCNGVSPSPPVHALLGRQRPATSHAATLRSARLLPAVETHLRLLSDELRFNCSSACSDSPVRRPRSRGCSIHFIMVSVTWTAVRAPNVATAQADSL